MGKTEHTEDSNAARQQSAFDSFKREQEPWKQMIILAAAADEKLLPLSSVTEANFVSTFGGNNFPDINEVQSNEAVTGIDVTIYILPNYEGAVDLNFHFLQSVLKYTNDEIAAGEIIQGALGQEASIPSLTDAVHDVDTFTQQVGPTFLPYVMVKARLKPHQRVIEDLLPVSEVIPIPLHKYFDYYYDSEGFAYDRTLAITDIFYKQFPSDQPQIMDRWKRFMRNKALNSCMSLGKKIHAPVILRLNQTDITRTESLSPELFPAQEDRVILKEIPDQIIYVGYKNQS